MKAYRNILAVLLAIVISFSFPCISFALDDTAVQERPVRTVCGLELLNQATARVHYLMTPTSLKKCVATVTKALNLSHLLKIL